MKKVVLLLLLSFAVIGNGFAAETVTLKLATVLPAQAPPVVNALKPWSEMIEKESGGTLKIEIFPGGVLGNNMRMYFQQIDTGVFDMALIYPSYFGERFSEQELFFLPFVASTYMEGAVAAQTLCEKGLFPGFEKYRVLFFVASSPFHIATTFPVKAPEDLKGHKFRSGSKIQADLIARLGMTPVGIPANEAAEALSRGLVEGVLGDPTNLLSFRLADAARNLITVPMGNFSLLLAMNKQKAETLPPKAKAALDKYSGLWLAKFWAEKLAPVNEKILAEWKKDPTRKIVEPNEEQLAKWRAIMQPVTDAWLKADPGREKLFKEFQAEVERVRKAK